MQQQARSLRRLCISSIIIISIVWYYLKFYSLNEPSISIKTLSTLSPSKYKIVEMNEHFPSFKLATVDGNKPYADGDRAQNVIVQSLKLATRCKEDPSLIVVDIGAFLGEFGLYAAACGCQVFMFEVQSNMIDLIQTSIAINNFSTSRVHLIPRAVNDLPSNSQLKFSLDGGGTRTLENGTFHVSTIRLDDIKWPKDSTILLLKIDVEGFELNVLRSAERLFQQQRIQHLIFEYTAWWTDRAPQKELLNFVELTLKAKQFYALDRTGTTIYGPLNRTEINNFYIDHINRHLQTDIYAIFGQLAIRPSFDIKPYVIGQSFA